MVRGLIDRGLQSERALRQGACLEKVSWYQRSLLGPGGGGGGRRPLIAECVEEVLSPILFPLLPSASSSPYGGTCWREEGVNRDVLEAHV